MLWVRFLNDDFQTSFFILFSSFWLFFFCISTSLVEVGAWDVQGLPPMAQSAPRQSYAPMACKPAPSCHEPSRQWNQAPVTRIYRGRIKGERDGGKRMIQRINEEWPPGKRCTEHMEVMQARQTGLEPNDWPLTTPSLLVVNCVK